MNLCVTTQHRFDRTPDGAFWTDSAFPYAFWNRYREEFPEVRVLARVRDVPMPPPRAARSDGPGVTFAPVPYYVGPWAFMLNRGNVRTAMRRAIGPYDAVLFRVPAPLPALCLDFLSRRGQPFGVEVLGDPIDLFSPGTYTTPALPLIRFLTWLELRRICRRAAVAAYVTREALQRRYPTKGVSFGYSDVSLAEGELACRPRKFPGNVPPFRLLFVGSLHHRQKGPDVLLRAVRDLQLAGLDISITIVGDGPERPGLEGLAGELGITACVRFAGTFSERRMIMELLREAHLFVLPSRAEGLPKALVEAMATGLPCLSTPVGGIPEILEAEDLVPAGDHEALARAIERCLVNPARWEDMSRRNVSTARRFTSTHLNTLHHEFLRELHRQTVAHGERALRN
ncbi:MAG: Alpha-D-kanosaminyltransferase [bacterium ADurb.Bin374]|nr:MAG: Alpha-D-kanosaminyltransferase [bacterium ADurb.Bin374]